jgi:hypothetical protein
MTWRVTSLFKTESVSPSRWQTPAAIALQLGVLWGIVSNYLCQDFFVYPIPTPFEYGVLTFFFLLGLCGLVLIARHVRGSEMAVSRSASSTKLACVVGVALIAGFLGQQVYSFVNCYNDPAHSDLTLNTWTADRNFFDLNENPYSTDCQQRHDPTNAPHVSRVGQQLYMFGVPYDFGYAYFPAMFISYEPFRHLQPSVQYIRTANAVFYLVTLVAMAWLAALFAPPGLKALASVLTVATFVCNLLLGWEYFFLGTVDVVIPMLLLSGFIAAYYERPTLAGVLFGWAFACKLLPGGFICLIVGAWFWRRPERWKFWIPMVATSLAAIVPFVLRNPPAFLSATVLYYLTEHAHGDRSSMYFFLPSGIQAGFMIGGYVLTLTLLVMAMVRKGQTLLGVIASSFIVFIVFMAFSKLSHDNYFFAVAPLGSVALIGYALKSFGSSKPIDVPMHAVEAASVT